MTTYKNKKIKTMKNKINLSRGLHVRAIIGILLVSMTSADSFSQQIPSCKRLKDITDSVKIGAYLQEGISPLFSGISTGPDTAGFRGIANREFNSAQTAWFPNWGGWIAPSTYDFSAFALDTITNWAYPKGKYMALHTTIAAYDEYLPPWFVSGSWTNAQMDTMMKDMIYSLMDDNNNKNKYSVINLCNEVLNDDGTYRSNMKWNQLGWEPDQSGLTGIDQINTQHPVFIAKAFQYFRDKTNAKLELRDYNIEILNASTDTTWVKKHRGFYQLLKHLLNTGVPVDAVGIQGHYDLWGMCWDVSKFYANNDLRDAILKFRAAGVEVYISELDIGICSDSSASYVWTPADDSEQKNAYYTITNQILDGGAKLINFWGIQDRDPNWRTYDNHMLFDSVMNVKPAYYGVQQALLEYTGDTAAQSPFLGSPSIFPGKLEAENYDNSCNGSSYYDADAVNSGNANWRDDNVDIDAAGTGNYLIQCYSPGEWREYTVDIPNGVYDITARIASSVTSAVMTIQLGNGPDGNTFIALTNMNIPNTGGNTVFQNYSINNVNVTNGGNGKVLRLETTGASFNIDWIEFNLTNSVNENNYSNSFYLYPNPSSGIINLVFSNHPEKGTEIQLMDLTGRVVKSGTLPITTSGNTTFQLDLSNLLPGIYLLKSNDQYLKIVLNPK